MTWTATDIDGPVIAVRAIHFAAAAMTAGAIVFRATVAEPALRSQRKASAVVSSQIRMLAWVGLAIAVISGAIWLVVLTESLSDEGFREAIISGAVRDVLTLTQFGAVAQVRLALATMVAIGLALDRSRWGGSLALAAVLGLVASIAWTGHAASTPEGLGYVHLASDALHLCAASAWIGGLLPLVLLLHASKRDQPLTWPPLELVAARRFSVLGIACVATLIVSGGMNAWILVGSFRGLILTAYGLILTIKLFVFATMLAFAAVNRLYLTPELASAPESGAQCEAVRRLTRNAIVEIALGLLIFAIVGVLGTLHPAAHFAH
jgi:copper resistance protein D